MFGDLRTFSVSIWQK